MSNKETIWKRRSGPEEFTCPSGQKVLTQPPGPAFTLKLGRTTRVFTTPEGVPKKRDDQTEEEYGLEVLEHISDDELVESARLLLVAMCIKPKLSLNPDYVKGELHPDDTETDFWPLYQYGMQKYFGRKGKVQTGDEEAEVTDLESFRDESSVSRSGVDSIHVPVAEPESAATDQGLADSAGA